MVIIYYGKGRFLKLMRKLYKELDANETESLSVTEFFKLSEII